MWHGTHIVRHAARRAVASRDRSGVACGGRGGGGGGGGYSTTARTHTRRTAFAMPGSCLMTRHTGTGPGRFWGRYLSRCTRFDIFVHGNTSVVTCFVHVQVGWKRGVGEYGQAHDLGVPEMISKLGFARVHSGSCRSGGDANHLSGSRRRLVHTVNLDIILGRGAVSFLTLVVHHTENDNS